MRHLSMVALSPVLLRCRLSTRTPQPPSTLNPASQHGRRECRASPAASVGEQPGILLFGAGGGPACTPSCCQVLQHRVFLFFFVSRGQRFFFGVHFFVQASRKFQVEMGGLCVCDKKNWPFSRMVCLITSNLSDQRMKAVRNLKDF